MMDWTKLPKIELHLHLDCSLSYKAVSQIDTSITLDRYKSEFIAPPKCFNVSDYLTRAPNFYPLMQTKENLNLVTLDLFEQLREDNLIYAEIRYAPLLHLKEGLTPTEVVSSVEAAVAEGVHRTGIEARIILCTLRYYSKEQSLETVKLVESFRDSYVAGFDIAAETTGDVIGPHLPAFQYAREKDIPFTAHVGETRGIKNVWETLENFDPPRVGHGVCSIEDPKLLEHLQAHQIHLEACPTSNVQTNCYDTYADHPIDKLLKAGISIGVNTDSRTISNITLCQEYEKLNDTFGWTPADFYQTNNFALNAAFLPENTKTKLQKKLDDGFQQYL
jgi:adenosine deaminase